MPLPSFPRERTRALFFHYNNVDWKAKRVAVSGGDGVRQAGDSGRFPEFRVVFE